MKNKILNLLVVTAMTLGATFGLTACGLSDMKTTKINSVEDLFAISSNKNYELGCDIDLNGRLWSPKSVNNFNGNGHTIKNVTITDAYEGSKTGFFIDAIGVKNVVFENVNIVASFTESAIGYLCAGFVSSRVETRGFKSFNLENITVKNSNMVITSLSNSQAYVGGLCGYATVSRVSGCSVENCTISVMTAKSFNDWLHVGGIVGQYGGDSISDCKISDSSLTCKGLCYVNIGGIAGEINRKGSAVNLISTGNEMTLDMTGTSNVSRFGGVIGNIENDNSEVSNIVSKDNVLKVNASKTYGVGGAVGRNNGGLVKNGLADGNEITATLLSDDGSKFAYAGGFCGINNGSVSRCVSQYSQITGTDYGNPWNTNYGAIKFTCGFVGRTDGSLAYCGVKDNIVEGMLTEDLLSGTGIANFCLVNVTDEEWADAIPTLNLDTALWKFENGKLILKILEN